MSNIITKLSLGLLLLNVTHAASIDLSNNQPENSPSNTSVINSAASTSSSASQASTSSSDSSASTSSSDSSASQTSTSSSNSAMSQVSGTSSNITFSSVDTNATLVSSAQVQPQPADPAPVNQTSLKRSGTTKSQTIGHAVQVKSVINQMSKLQRKSLIVSLNAKSDILQTIIPIEQQMVAKTKLFCGIFFNSCFKSTSASLGKLALDLVADLSDGKLDGKGPNGSVDYLHDVLEIVIGTIQEMKAEGISQVFDPNYGSTATSAPAAAPLSVSASA